MIAKLCIVRDNLILGTILVFLYTLCIPGAIFAGLSWCVRRVWKLVRRNG